MKTKVAKVFNKHLSPKHERSYSDYLAIRDGHAVWSDGMIYLASETDAPEGIIEKSDFDLAFRIAGKEPETTLPEKRLTSFYYPKAEAAYPKEENLSVTFNIDLLKQVLEFAAAHQEKPCLAKVTLTFESASRPVKAIFPGGHALICPMYRQEE